MDYKRNYLYFKDPRRFNFLWMFFFLIVAGGAVYTGFAALVTPALVGYGLGVVFILIGFAFGKIFPLRYHIKDSYIDKQITSSVAIFEKMALDQLKIQEIQNDHLKRIHFYDFTDETKYKDVEVLSRVGLDEKRRTSQCRLICYFFLEGKFIAYHYEFSLIKPWLAEGYTNYYYSEISTKEVHEVNTEDNPYLQMVEIVNK